MGGCCGRTTKDELRIPDPRGSLANDIPSCAIEQANQEVWQDDRHSKRVKPSAKCIVISIYLNSVFI